MKDSFHIKKGRIFSSPFFIYSALILFILLASYLSIMFGGPVSLLSSDTGSTSLIIWEIRYPRLIASLLVGASLSLSGFVFQNVLKNPLADPYILGISSGAALGIALFVTFCASLSTLGAELSALAGAMLALTILLMVFRFLLHNTLVVVLVGIGISFFFSSIITFLLSYMEGNQLVYMNSWLIGNIAQPEMSELYVLAVVFILATSTIYLFSNSLDALQFGDDFATSSGVSARFFSILFIVIASILAASCVAVCGTLGFVGLVIPHIARLILKARTVKMIPLIILLGAGFLTLCNAIAGSLSIKYEVPVGAVTSLIGAPALIYLICRRYSARS